MLRMRNGSGSFRAALACLFVTLSSSCAPKQAAPAPTAPSAAGNGKVVVRLSGGTGSTLSNWSPSGVVWDTLPGGPWVLGVASGVTAPLLNLPDTRINEIPGDSFYGFGEPDNPGPTAKLEVIRSDGSAFVGLFAVRGANGSGQTWTLIDGSRELGVSWSSDLADRVGPGESMTPSGDVDAVFRVTIGAARASEGTATTDGPPGFGVESAAAVRISGGSGSSLADWKPGRSVWDTTPGGAWVLGIATGLTAPLMNFPDTRIRSIPERFFAFGEPDDPGPIAKVEVILEDGRALVSLFAVQGKNGSGEAWRLIDGSRALTVGWSPGFADRVGSADTLAGSGTVDNVFRVEVQR